MSQNSSSLTTRKGGYPRNRAGRAFVLLLRVSIAAIALAAALPGHAQFPPPPAQTREAPAPKLAQAPPRLAAGPVYTSVDGSNGPAWPKADIVLRNVSIANPGAAHLVQEGLDKGTAITLRRFEEGGYPIEVVMAIDASGSMKGRPLKMLRSSLARFVDEARQQDRVAIATFADDTRWDVPFGSPRADLQKALNGIDSRGHFTHLYDSLLDCLGEFDSGDARVQRRELIVMSDGHDEGSQHSLEDVVAEAKRLNIAIDSIGVTRSSPQFLKNLQTLSQATDGGFRAARTDAELQNMVSHAIGTLKAQPLATFDLSGLSHDGQPHPVQIQVDGASQTADLTITSPAGTAEHAATAANGGGSKAEGRSFPARLTNRKNLWWVVAIAVLLLLLVVAPVVALTRRRKPAQDEFWAHGQQPQQHGIPPQPQVFLPRIPSQQPGRPRDPMVSQPRPAWPMTEAQRYPLQTPTESIPAVQVPIGSKPMVQMPGPPPSYAASSGYRNTGSGSAGSGSSGSGNVAWPAHPAPSIPDTNPFGHPIPAPAPASASARPVRLHTRMAQFFDARPGQAFARLTATQGPLRGRAADVAQPTLRVGAARDNDLIIDGDDSLSSHHACFLVEAGLWMIEDLHSTNGTFVNGERLSGARRQLAPGDLVGIGRSAFRVDRSDA